MQLETQRLQDHRRSYKRRGFPQTGWLVQPLRSHCGRHYWTTEPGGTIPSGAEDGSRGAAGGRNSHDYNNLLGVILGNTDLLLETTPTGVQLHYADQIKKATRRAAELTRQLLAFSRKQIGRASCRER